MSLESFAFSRVAIVFRLWWRFQLVYKFWFLWFLCWLIAASSAMTRGLRVAMIDSSPKQPTFRKHDPNAIPDQRVSAITPATVRFFQGLPLSCDHVPPRSSCRVIICHSLLFWVWHKCMEKVVWFEAWSELQMLELGKVFYQQSLHSLTLCRWTAGLHFSYSLVIVPR